MKRHTVKDRGTIFCLFVIFLRRASWLIQTFTVLQAVQAWAWTKKSALEGRLQWDLFWEEKEFHFVLWKLCGRRQRYHPITFVFYFKTSKVLTNVNVYLAPSIFQASSQLVTHSSPQSFDQSVSQSVSETVRQSVSQSVSHWLRRRAYARNVSLKTLYGGQFTRSTQWIKPNYSVFQSVSYSVFQSFSL